MAVAPHTGALWVPRRRAARIAAEIDSGSASALIRRAQVLGGQAESGSGEVLKRDAARDRAAGSVSPVPIKDQHPGRSA
jgi:hypothetical protein